MLGVACDGSDPSNPCCYDINGNLVDCDTGTLVDSNGNPLPFVTAVGGISCNTTVGNVSSGCTGACPEGCNCDSSGNVLGCPGTSNTGTPGSGVGSGSSTTVGGVMTNTTGGILAGLGQLTGGILKGIGITAGQQAVRPTTAVVTQSPLSGTTGLFLVIAVIAVFAVFELKKGKA